MSLVLVEPLIALRLSCVGPLLLILACDYQSVVDKFLIGESSDLFWSLGAVGGEVFDGAGKYVDLDAHVVD